MVDLPLWKIWVRQLGSLFPIYGKIKSVPNISKPQTSIIIRLSMCDKDLWSSREVFCTSNPTRTGFHKASYINRGSRASIHLLETPVIHQKCLQCPHYLIHNTRVTISTLKHHESGRFLPPRSAHTTCSVHFTLSALSLRMTKNLFETTNWVRINSDPRNMHC